VLDMLPQHLVRALDAAQHPSSCSFRALSCTATCRSSAATKRGSLGIKMHDRIEIAHQLKYPSMMDLLRELEVRTESLGLASLTLDAGNGHVDAQRFYCWQGFELVGKFVLFSKPLYVICVMFKRL